MCHQLPKKKNLFLKKKNYKKIIHLELSIQKFVWNIVYHQAAKLQITPLIFMVFGFYTIKFYFICINSLHLYFSIKCHISLSCVSSSSNKVMPHHFYHSCHFFFFRWVQVIPGVTLQSYTFSKSLNLSRSNGQKKNSLMQIF